MEDKRKIVNIVFLSILVTVLFIYHLHSSNREAELRRNQVLTQESLIESIRAEEDFTEDLKMELRECLKDERNYTAIYKFSWCGGDPHIDFVFTLPSVECPCGSGQLTPKRTVTLRMYQKFSGDWYILDTNIEYEKPEERGDL